MTAADDPPDRRDRLSVVRANPDHDPLRSADPASQPMDWSALEDPGPFDEYDTPAEVDAVFRTQRRIAFGYLAVFALVVLGVPVLTVALDWWSTGRLIGAITPAFAMAAAGLYLVFLLIGVGAASLASAVEDRMLGGGPAREDPPHR